MTNCFEKNQILPLELGGGFFKNNESGRVLRVDGRVQAVLTELNEVNGFLKNFSFQHSQGLMIVPFEIASSHSPFVWIEFEEGGCWHEMKSTLGEKVLGKHLSFEKYKKNFLSLKDEISRGNVYEVNLCHETYWPKNHIDLSQLYAASGGPGFYGKVGNHLVSYSPESFVTVFRDSSSSRLMLSMEPMKGTLPKSYSRQQAVGQFACDPKLSCELRLITDMVRHDLAKVCQLGSVTSLGVDLRETPYVWQAVQKSIGALKDGHGLTWLLDLLPAASISGAPKQEAVKFIGAHERFSRGYYTGVLMVVSGGELRSSVMIRTLVSHNQSWWRYGIGGGVVWESDLQQEWEESLIKAGFLGSLEEAEMGDL